MFEELRRHPSPVAKAAVDFLSQLKIADRTKQEYETVLTLFIDSLMSDPSEFKELDDGMIVLTRGWDFYGGAVDGFLDWWLPRKWMGPDAIAQKAPNVFRKWFRWCHEHGQIDKERLDDFLEALPKNKVSQVKRLQKAGELLHRLHNPDPGAWMRPDRDKVATIRQRQKPKAIEEGYMTVEQIQETSCGLSDENGKQVSPVHIGKELASQLREGDIVNVTVGLFSDTWSVLESGNVYAEGTF